MAAIVCRKPPALRRARRPAGADDRPHMAPRPCAAHPGGAAGTAPAGSWPASRGRPGISPLSSPAPMIDLPVPRRLQAPGNLLHLFLRPEQFIARHTAGGPIRQVELPGSAPFFVADPDVIDDVLVG